MFMLGCSCIHKYVVNRDSMNGEVYELQVHNFQEIPEDILDNIDKMGVDESAILNEYEGKYLNFIFKINPEEFDLVGKKVAFLKVGNKADYFDSTRSPDRKGTTVGGGVDCISLIPHKKRRAVVMMLQSHAGVRSYCP